MCTCDRRAGSLSSIGLPEDRSPPRTWSVLFTRVALIPNDPVGRVSVTAVGSGNATLFQNGQVVKGNWSKTSTNGPLVLTTTNGSPMSLVPGQTWIEVVPPGDLTSAVGS